MDTVKLEEDELGITLNIPQSKREEIKKQSCSAAEQREALIHYFLSYSEYASWKDLASRLYCREHKEALQLLEDEKF